VSIKDPRMSTPIPTPIELKQPFPAGMVHNGGINKPDPLSKLNPTFRMSEAVQIESSNRRKVSPIL
jgi:hypothetical protein